MIFAVCTLICLPISYQKTDMSQKELRKAVWSGTEAMMKNDGSITNEKAFWRDFEKHFGKIPIETRQAFEEFYRNDFNKISTICPPNPAAKEIIKTVKSLDLIPVLATNPVFPSIATENRIRWAGYCHPISYITQHMKTALSVNQSLNTTAKYLTSFP